jgi:hypothetical protein
MPSHPLRLLTMPMLQNYCAVMALLREIQSGGRNAIEWNVSE